MVHAAFAVEPGGPKRLKVAWRIGWRDFVVRFDGSKVASFPGELPLAGLATPLPDGSHLDLTLLRGTANGTVLEIKRNGVALADDGQVVEAERQLRTAAGWLYFAAGLRFLVGVVAPLLGDVLPSPGAMFALAIIGAYCVILGALGYLVGRGSMAAAIAAFAVFVLDWVAIAMLTGKPFAGIWIHLITLVALYKAISKMRDLRNLKDASGGFA